MKFTILSSLLLTGCGTFGKQWEDAPLTYQCTPDQMTRVETETRFCAKETGYTAERCYGSAMVRNCKQVVK